MLEQSFKTPDCIALHAILHADAAGTRFPRLHQSKLQHSLELPA